MNRAATIDRQDTALIADRLVVGHQALVLKTGVRIALREPTQPALTR